MDIDKKAIYDDLIKEFIAYQWRIDNPWPQSEETFEAMRRKYLDDPVFHTKVKSMVTGVMSILNRHI